MNIGFWKVLFNIHNVVNALDEILDLVESRHQNLESIAPQEIIGILKRYSLWPW